MEILLWKFPGFPGCGRSATAQRSSIQLQNIPTLRPPDTLFARAGELLKTPDARLKGERATPFVYKAPGQLASIGRLMGVASVLGQVFRSHRAVRRAIVYLMKLPKLEKKIRVGLQWARELVLERDIAQYINPRDVESVYRLFRDSAATP